MIKSVILTPVFLLKHVQPNSKEKKYINQVQRFLG
jgi:hypothetical protein